MSGPADHAGQSRLGLGRSRALPSRQAVLAITAALWTGQFAARVANGLLDHGMGPAAAHIALSSLLAALLGAGLCLALGHVLRRLAMAQPSVAIGILLVLCAAAAVTWSVADAAAIRPVSRAMVEAAGLEIASSPEVRNTLAISWLFIAWAGIWLAIAFSDRLQADASEAEEAIGRLQALLALRTSASGETESGLWVAGPNTSRYLALSDVTHVTAERDYARVHARGGASYLIRAPLHRLLADFDDPRFLRVHRSSLVNGDHVREIRRSGERGYDLLLDDGSAVAVGRRHAKAVEVLKGRAATRGSSKTG